MEQWTNTGSRRLVTMLCGHLFCQECAERVISEQMNSTSGRESEKLKQIRCPFCRTNSMQAYHKLKKTHYIPLYTETLLGTMDSTALDEIKTEFQEMEKQLKLTTAKLTAKDKMLTFLNTKHSMLERSNMLLADDAAELRRENWQDLLKFLLKKFH